MLRLFGDKVEAIKLKEENYQKLVSEYKNLKISTSVEDYSNLNLTEEDLNEVKSMNVANIAKAFNQSREAFESCMKEIKSTFSSNKSQVESHSNARDVIVLKSSENNLVSVDSGQDLAMRNELARLVKENTSLRIELNYLYYQLKEGTKIVEIKEDKQETKLRRSYTNNSPEFTLNSQNMMSNNSHRNSNPNATSKISGLGSSQSQGNMTNKNSYLIKLKSDAKDEFYIDTKKYIKMLRQSEFII